MPITHLTSTPVFQSGTGNRTVAPNASTAVGDLMVLPVAFQDVSATTISAPAGWPVQKSAVLTGTLKTSLFTRVRQPGDSSWTYGPNQSVETSDVILSVVGGDPASLIVGADGTRAASGGTTATTAPTITTTVAGSRVYIIATERTTANETVEATVNNGFTKIVHAFANGTSAESIFLAYKDMPSAGPVGATTVTYQNSQGTNGYAVLIAVAPATTSHAIAGTAAAASTASAVLTTRQPVSGAAVASSATSGVLAVALALSGTVSATSGTTAALTARLSLAGAVQASSTVSGSIASTGMIAGVAEVVSSVDATFSVDHAPIDVIGSSAVVSAIVGILTVSRGIVGGVDWQSSATAELASGLVLEGVFAAASNVLAEFTVGGSIPVPPVPKVRTLTGEWSAVLTETPVAWTLTGADVTRTLEDA